MKKEAALIKLIDIVKTNRITYPLYRKMKSYQNSKRFNLNSINMFEPFAGGDEKIRFNLVLPTMRKTRVFAGISSAIDFFGRIAEDSDWRRVIVTGNEQFSQKDTFIIEGYKKEKTGQKTMQFASDDRLLEVNKNDVFVFTSWKTAYAFLPILDWQIKTFSLTDRKSIYLIQDFEPGFYPWSTEYALAESTYVSSNDRIVAVFNSQQLYTFFKEHGYMFAEEYYFRPGLNKKLKQFLMTGLQEGRALEKRKKRILIYGRPSEARNAFEIIRASLEQWSSTYTDSKQWEIISLGEGFENVKLTNNVIISKG